MKTLLGEKRSGPESPGLAGSSTHPLPSRQTTSSSVQMPSSEALIPDFEKASFTPTILPLWGLCALLLIPSIDRFSCCQSLLSTMPCIPLASLIAWVTLDLRLPSEPDCTQGQMCPDTNITPMQTHADVHMNPPFSYMVWESKKKTSAGAVGNLRAVAGGVQAPQGGGRCIFFSQKKRNRFLPGLKGITHQKKRNQSLGINSPDQLAAHKIRPQQRGSTHNPIQTNAQGAPPR